VRPSPAESLIGIRLQENWNVVQKLTKDPATTGGFFSHGYIVEGQGGIRAYLKALDFSAALRSPDPAEALQGMTEAYNSERQLCSQCQKKSFDRVVRYLCDGKVLADPDDPNSIVQYIIFELADGDVRLQLDRFTGFDIAWTLRALHHIATGLKQLHSINIAHQDIKPSNILVFQERVSKLADLGRAASRNSHCPHEDFPIAGDRSYAPPELLYGFVDPDWNRRRLGCDLYLLGSMVVFLFARVNMTSLIFSHLSSDHRPEYHADGYNVVLPYMEKAFYESLEDFRNQLPNLLVSDVVDIVRQLCFPNPEKRGHPCNHFNSGSQYSLERYVTQFDLLARKAEIGIFGTSK